MPYKSIVEQVKPYTSPFYLDDILVSPTLNELCIDEKVVKLEPKVMAVLLMLVEHEGEVVTRQALMAGVWQGMVVGDEVVTRAIFELRRAFADNAKNPRFIATIPKKGYRCQVIPRWPVTQQEVRQGIQQVTQQGIQQEAQPGSPPVTEPAKGRLKRVYLFAGSLLPLCLLPYLYSKAFFVEQARMTAALPSPVTAVIQSQPETSLTGIERDPAISKDGLWLAFSHQKSKALPKNIYIKNLKTSEITQLTDNSASEAYPQWSEDGHRLAFVRCQQKQLCNIVSKNIATLKEHTLLRSEQAITCLAWSQMLAKMAFCRENKGASSGTHLSLLNLNRLDSGDPVEKLSPGLEGYYRDRAPVFTSDGNTLVFVRGLAKGNDIIAYQVEQRQLKTLLSSQSYISHLSFTGEEQFLLLSQIKDSRWGLWYTPFNLNEIDTLALRPLLVNSDKSSLRQPVVNPVKKRLYYIKGRGERNITRHLVHENSNNVLVASTANDYDGQVSPDNQQLAFISNRTGAQEIWLADLHGRQQQKLTQGHFDRVDQLHWSSDGKLLAIKVNKDKENRLLIVDVAAKTTRQQLIVGAGEQVIAWSADGLSLLLGVLKEQQYRLYRLSLKHNHRELLVKDAGPLAVESEDGSLLYYYHYRDHALYQRDLLTGTEQVLAHNVKIEGFINGGFSQQHFYYVDASKGELWQIALATGQKSKLGNDLPGDARLSNMGRHLTKKGSQTGEYLLFDATYNHQMDIRSFLLPDNLQ